MSRVLSNYTTGEQNKYDREGVESKRREARGRWEGIQVEAELLGRTAVRHVHQRRGGGGGKVGKRWTEARV